MLLSTARLDSSAEDLEEEVSALLGSGYSITEILDEARRQESFRWHARLSHAYSAAERDPTHPTWLHLAKSYCPPEISRHLPKRHL